MPPNDQNQPSSSPPSQTPLNVPDFLHLDPIPDPAEVERKKKKKRLILFSLLSLAVVSIVGVGAYALYSSTQFTPEERFKAALENSLRVKYMRHETEVSFTSKNAITKFNSESTLDLSNPLQPKSESEYSYSNELEQLSQKPHALKVTGQYAIVDTNTVHAKITEFTASIKPQGIVTGVWHTIASNNEKVQIYDVTQSRNNQSRTFTGWVFGNYDDTKSAKLLTYMINNQTFTLKDIQQSNQNNKAVSMFKLESTGKKLNNMNKQASSILGLSNNNELFDPAATVTCQIWIEHATNRLEKIITVSETKASGERLQVAMDIDYPAQVAINKPN